MTPSAHFSPTCFVIAAVSGCTFRRSAARLPAQVKTEERTARTHAFSSKGWQTEADAKQASDGVCVQRTTEISSGDGLVEIGSRGWWNSQEVVYKTTHSHTAGAHYSIFI